MKALRAMAYSTLTAWWGARAVITDSGTVQEECCLFQIPNVTIRDVTERAETIQGGRLTGAVAGHRHRPGNLAHVERSSGVSCQARFEHGNQDHAGLSSRSILMGADVGKQTTPQPDPEFFYDAVPQFDAFYENQNQIFSYELLRRKTLTIEALARYLAPDSAALIVEIGCGTGRVISEIVQTYPIWHGVGLDISKQMIAHCLAHYGSLPHLSFAQHNVDHGPADYLADAVLALGVIGYLQDPALAFDHIHAMLKPGGYFIFSVTKPSLPISLTRWYRRVRFIHKPELQRKLSLSNLLTVQAVSRMLDGKFQVLETYDYCYIPSIRVVRRWVGVSEALERRFGKHPTTLSSTTLLITHRIEQAGTPR
jgi:SAM-dependent methyltransferase